MRSSALLTSSTAYRANVTTVPAVVQQATVETYDPDDQHLYIVGWDASNSVPIIYRVAKSGATTIFYTFPSGYYYSTSISGIAYDHATQTFYITSQSGSGFNAPAILAITTGGAFSVLAGGATSGTSDGTGSAASFSDPTGIAVDEADGALYVGDHDRMRRITTTGVVTTFTPAGSLGNSSYYYGNTFGVVWDAYDGNIYVADASADVIRKVT
ncbi:MAG TPA: hypothetical protein VKT72_06645, partial [Candidatus Baltobacteraceae bacterium]|nr:hypothetical protein [Candidatus Baltobacteraceae bacterium]